MTIGLQQDWPPDVVVKTHDIKVTTFSSFEKNIFALGGNRFGRAVVSLWRFETTEGITTAHPCETPNCEVNYVSFHQPKKMKTGCKCGNLYTWDISDDDLKLSNQKTCISFTPEVKLWANDGSRALSLREAKPIDSYSYYIFSVQSTSDMPYELCQESPVFEGIWMFSPRDGQRIAHLGFKLEVWDCFSKRELLDRALPADSENDSLYEKDLRSFNFSPDAQYIIYEMLGSIQFISLEDGCVLWECRLLDAKLSDNVPSNVIENPGKKEKFTLLISSILNSKTPDTISPTYCGSGLLTLPDVNGISNSDIRSVFEKYIKQGVVKHVALEVQPVEDRSDTHTSTQFVSPNITTERSTIIFHFQHPNKRHDEQIFGKMKKVLNYFLSPDGLYLFTIHEDKRVYLWKTNSGERFHIRVEESLRLERNYHIEFAPDSSAAILRQEKILYSVDIGTGQLTKIQDKVNAATFFPRSKRILMIRKGGHLVSLNLDDGCTQNICTTSPFLSSTQMSISISPSGQLIAISDMSKKTVVIDHEQIGQYDLPFDGAVFASDGRSLCTARFSNEGDMYIPEYEVTLKHIKISDHRLCISTRRMKFRTEEHSFFTQTIEVGDRTFLSVLSVSDWIKRVPLYLDSSNGRKVIVATLHVTGDTVFYGKYRLMQLPDIDIDDRPKLTRGNHLAYKNRTGEMTVLDCSLLIAEV
jgi:WD40 repeat protein